MHLMLISGRTKRKWGENSCGMGRNRSSAFAEGVRLESRQEKSSWNHSKGKKTFKTGKKKLEKKNYSKEQTQICWKKMSQPLKQLLTITIAKCLRKRKTITDIFPAYQITTRDPCTISGTGDLF